ncbi:MAG: ferrous iron transport protein B [Deltaproteobacteria bacterium]
MTRTAILVGNPNVGKSALFGALTGRYVTVSNYPGTTVEVTRGSGVLGKRDWHVLDTPGANGLLPASEDEQATRDILLSEREFVVVQVCDAKNLTRGLLMTAQLAEAGVPLVLALNMSDEAAGRGIRIDVSRLAAELGIPVVETVAVQRRGLSRLASMVDEARPSKLRVSYDAALEAAIAQVEALLPPGQGLSSRAIAIMALAGDESLRGFLAARVPEQTLSKVDALRRSLAGRESLRFSIARQRLAAVERLQDSVVTRSETGETAERALRKLGDWSVHPVLGVPVLFAVLTLCYLFVGQLGAKTAVDFLEAVVFKQYLVPWATSLLAWLHAPALLSGDAGLIIGRYGLFSMGLSYGVAIVLPIVTTFFLAFSVLEDSGYLPRLAAMLNRAFRLLGLNGKAVLPLILGLGCDTMATLTARILETKKERVVVTLLLALAIPCSAQLAVIFAMLAGIHLAASLWFLGAIASVMLLVGFLAARIIPGRGSDFILELPPLRFPQPGNVLVKTVARVEWYAKEALPLFLLGTAVLWGMDRVGALAVLERAAAPVVTGLLGLPRETAGAFILGFLRRDYAAAGLFAQIEPALRAGTVTREMEVQIVVALVTVTLFLPCIAQLFMMLKERGTRVTLLTVGFILPFAFGMGGLLNVLMRRFYL